MDSELFSIIHEVAESESADKRNKIIFDWASHLGSFKSEKKIPVCPGVCESLNNSWIRDCRLLGKNLSRLLERMERAKRKYLSRFAREDIPGYFSFQFEKTYRNILSKDAGFRLLFLFRLWNAVKYFSPDAVPEGKMDSLLERFIPKFITCSSDGELESLSKEIESCFNGLKFCYGPDTLQYSVIKPLSITARSGYCLLGNNMGYLYPGTLTYEKLDNAMYQFSDTRGIIIDLRSSPKEFLSNELASYFVKSRVCFALQCSPDYNFPGRFLCKEVFCRKGSHNKLYGGRIVLIVNNKTSPEAESLAMCLQKAPCVTTIGGHTPGSAGKTIYLPLSYDGTGVYFPYTSLKYPDGTPLRGRGVKIDKIVEPSSGKMAGNSENGGDELLEEAKRIIME
jgi:hypothetical protein